MIAILLIVMIAIIVMLLVKRYRNMPTIDDVEWLPYYVGEPMECPPGHTGSIYEPFILWGKGGKVRVNSRYSISIARNFGTNGAWRGEYETAIIENGKGVVSTKVIKYDDVCGWMTEDEVNDFIRTVMNEHDLLVTLDKPSGWGIA